MLADAEAQTELLRSSLPEPDDILFRSHLHGVPGIVRGIPVVEVVVVHRLGEEVLGAGIRVELHQAVGIEVLRLPRLDHILPPVLGGMPVHTPMMQILIRALPVHITRIPVAVHRHGLWPPMRPNTELGIAEPVRAHIVPQRVPCRFERSLLNRLPLLHTTSLLEIRCCAEIRYFGAIAVKSIPHHLII